MKMVIGGIKVGNWTGLRRYLKAALRRCECELDPDRRDEIEEFLMKEYWLKGKPIPTRAGRTKDPAVKWALREKLRDAGFQNHTISSVTNEDGEEVDIFEVVGENEQRYTEIEQWHDIAVTIGVEPAKALLFSFYSEKTKKEKKQRQKAEKQEALF